METFKFRFVNMQDAERVCDAMVVFASILGRVTKAVVSEMVGLDVKPGEHESGWLLSDIYTSIEADKDGYCITMRRDAHSVESTSNVKWMFDSHLTSDERSKLITEGYTILPS